MNNQTSSLTHRTLSESLQEYARGIAGGIIFSLPLLYTMEVWWAGLVLSPLRLLCALAGVYALLLGYNRYAGLRPDASRWEIAIDSIEELGIGLVVAAVVLWLLGQLNSSMQLGESVAKVVVEALPVAIGVSVGTAQLGSGGGDDGGMAGRESDQHTDDNRTFFGQLVIALCGAVLFASNVAPTEEIIQIAFEASPWRMVLLVVASLLLGALILYFSDFRGTRTWRDHSGWKDMLSGIVITYAISLLASLVMLWFFGRLKGLGLYGIVTATVVLAAAANLGASAGRLLLQSGSSS